MKLINSSLLESPLLLESLIMLSILLVILCTLSMSVRDSFSSVESVKAASDAFCPASGKVVEVNTVSIVCYG